MRAAGRERGADAALNSAGAGGFTLIELIVAISLAAVLLATAPAALDRLQESMAYRDTVRQLIGDMKAARARALQTGRAVPFSFDLRERRFGVGANMEHVIPRGIKVRAIVGEREMRADGRGTIRFYPDGGATGGSIEVLRLSGQGVRLRVDWLLGRVSQEPLGG